MHARRPAGDCEDKGEDEMTYPEILGWAKKGLEAEIYHQTQMLNDAQRYDTPSAPRLRELLAGNVNDLNSKLDLIVDLLKDPTGLGR